jgi:hypothetical protein
MMDCPSCQREGVVCVECGLSLTECECGRTISTDCQDCEGTGEVEECSLQ